MKFIVFILLLIPFCSFTQKDTAQAIIETIVTDQSMPNIDNNQSLTKSEIDEISAVDIGELLQKISGVNLKSYGSLGGLKTVSMRGLGSNHTSIVKDGFTLSNAQTGQVNLGQIETDNVVGVISAVGERFKTILPISAQISGSTFLVKTFENTLSSDTLQVRASYKNGSFNQNHAYFGVKYRPKNISIALHGSSKVSTGDYSYSIENEFENTTRKRLNNDYKDYSVGANLAYRFKQGVSRIGFSHKSIEQGLPGAVILYNTNPDERLSTRLNQLNYDLQTTINKTVFRFYSSASKSFLEYVDLTYLNAIGGIEVGYTSRKLNTGLTMRAKLGDRFSINGGLEYDLSGLISSDTNFAKPIRNHLSALLASTYKMEKIYLELGLSTQYVDERNKNGQDGIDRLRVNPYLSLTNRSKNEVHWKHHFFYRNSFRLPSFNELYYNNIGNNQLKPEDAHQLNYGLSFVPVNKNLTLYVKSNLYFNRVQNKIVAIPTKNLFVWSIQNVGLAHIYGGEVNLRANYKSGQNWRYSLFFNYNFQKALDLTDKGSPTYNHQIAYIPIHTGNFDVSIYRKTTGVRISNYLVALRYSLNENIPSNVVEGFLIADATLFHTLKVNQKQSVKMQFTVKNLFNQSYAYIRSFVMPGRNYLITLSYAFN